MSHILHIDASPRGDRSVSRTLSKEFVDNWQSTHSHDTITYRDLGHHPVPLVDESWIIAAYSAPDQHTPEQAIAIRASNELVDEFLAADRYIFAVPMYNFGVLAGFKAYIDQIVRFGRTFTLDENGYQGLVLNKKALFILSQGGSYPQGGPAHSYDLQTPYIKLIFGFMGITDVEFIYADNLMANDDVREKSITRAKTELQDVLNRW